MVRYHSHGAINVGDRPVGKENTTKKIGSSGCTQINGTQIIYLSTIIWVPFAKKNRPKQFYLSTNIWVQKFKKHKKLSTKIWKYSNGNWKK